MRLHLSLPSWEQVQAFHHTRTYYVILFVAMTAGMTWIIASCGVYLELALTLGLLIATGITMCQHLLTKPNPTRRSWWTYKAGTGIVAIAAAVPLLFVPNAVTGFIAWGVNLFALMTIWYFTVPLVAKRLR